MHSYNRIYIYIYIYGDGGIYIHTIRGDSESVTKILDESVVFAVGER